MKTAFLSSLLVATTVTSSEAWTQNSSRRQFFGFMGSTAAAVAVANINPQEAGATAAKTGASSPFTGDYDDPNHPGCLRQVKVVGAPLRADGTRSAYPVMEITGYDGNGSGATCTERPTRSDLWKIQGTVKGNNLASIDFSPKGGPSNLLGKYEDGGIVFPDGNKWTKLARPSNDRRPADMSTLKSD